MKITPQTKILDIIRSHPDIIDVLASYNSRFRLLKNPVMRKTFARLATVQHAARVAGINLSDLIKLLNSTIGVTVSDEDACESGIEEKCSHVHVRDLIEQQHARITTLDVRDTMRSGGEPFNIIMKTVATVKQGQALMLETIFEPAPLYDVLRRKGFEHETEQLGEEHFRVWFYRLSEKTADRVQADARERIREEGDTVYLDVKGLEPPQPMALILETMAKLDPSKTLEVHHERVPVFLYPKLDERGYKHETHELDDRNVKLIIRK